MQNIGPKINYCSLKYILIITLSILFYGCNINYIKSTADITDKSDKETQINETQIHDSINLIYQNE